MIITSASLLAPYRKRTGSSTASASAEAINTNTAPDSSSDSGSRLLPETTIEILLPSTGGASSDSADQQQQQQQQQWLSAELLDIVTLPRVDQSIEIITKHGFQWKLGWPASQLHTATATQPAAADSAPTQQPWFLSSMMQRDWSSLTAVAVLAIRDEHHCSMFDRLRAAVPPNTELCLAPSDAYQVRRAYHITVHWRTRTSTLTERPQTSIIHPSICIVVTDSAAGRL